MKNKIMLSAGHQGQQGAALVIGLVLLTVLTLLTASSMSSSTLSLRMADNVKQADIASQASESALMRSLTSTAPYYTLSGVALNDPVRDPITYPYPATGTGAVSTVVSTLLRDRLSPTTGCEMDDQRRGSGCTYQYFEMNAVTTSTSSRGATQTQNMGFYIRVPN